MTTIEAVILGLVQGLTEFLPISSSGHLVLFEKILHVNVESVFSFNIAVHVATLVAVVAVLWKDIADIIRKPFSKLTLLLIAGTVPTLVIAVIFKDLFERLFESGASIGFEFLLTGLILLYADSVKGSNKGLNEMTYTDAAVTGIAQGIAILPAVSRSGLTISGALFRGLNREFAMRFSFLMSIPAILAAGAADGYEMLKSGSSLGADTGMMPLLMGMLAAAVSGYIAVRFMFRVFSKVSFKVFSYYVFVLGGLIIIDQLFFGILFNKFF